MSPSLHQTAESGIENQIRALLQKRRGILLAHNYQRPEIQDIADLSGDSLELSMKAAQTQAKVIVFCGVNFMAETASVLCPDKTVLLPVAGAGCPMADMITAQALREKRKAMPDACVISYVNTTAEVKAESDICCTSANVIQVVNAVDPHTRILMTPDKNLAQYAAHHTERDITWWEGYCPVHNNLTAEQVERVKKEHPDAPFVAHPECPPSVLELADAVKSTSGMLSYVQQSENTSFIIGTETGILYPLKKANPGKTFIPADPRMICADMKKTRLPHILAALETMQPEISVPPEIRTRAKSAVEKMLAVPGR